MIVEDDADLAGTVASYLAQYGVLQWAYCVVTRRTCVRRLLRSDRGVQPGAGLGAGQYLPSWFGQLGSVHAQTQRVTGPRALLKSRCCPPGTAAQIIYIRGRKQVLRAPSSPENTCIMVPRAPHPAPRTVLGYLFVC